MPCTDRPVPHLPERYARRLRRALADLETLTAPCWADDLLEYHPDGLAFSIQLTSARDVLADVLVDIGITTDDDEPDPEPLRTEHAAPAQADLL